MNVDRFLRDRPVSVEQRIFYECECCGALHSVEWDGDCRQDNARFFAEELDERFGFNGWTEITS